jgi:Zn-dependent alcohol dehydrogenase
VKRDDLAVGDFVLTSFNYCGACKYCKRDQPSTCIDGGKLHIGAVRPTDDSTPATLKEDGRTVRSMFFGQSTFARMSVVHESCIAMKYPYDPASAAIFAACGCGFQTGAGTVLNVLKPRPNDSVVIFGMGSVGLAAMMATKALHVEKIVAVDVLDSRLDLAKELGATDVLNAKDTADIVSAIKDMTGGGVDIAIDCAGMILLPFGP